MGRDVIEVAGELADGLLFSAAMAVDAADIVPWSHMDALADAGLYGLAGPPVTAALALTSRPHAPSSSAWRAGV